MLQPKVERSFSDEEGSSDYLFEFSDDDSDSSDMRYSLCLVLVCSLHVHDNLFFFFFCILSQVHLPFLSTVSQLLCADSVLATRQMPASCCLLQDPTTGFLVCQLQLLCLLHPNQQRQRGALKPQGSSPQPPLTSPQVITNITAYSLATDALLEFLNWLSYVIKSLSVLTLQIRIFAPALCAAPQDYRCPPRGLHLICTCCLQPMPDRRAELSSQQVAQQCEW